MAKFQFEAPKACSEGCGGCCLEVATNLADTVGMVAVRDTKSDRDIALSVEEWQAFTAAVKAGQFDV